LIAVTLVAVFLGWQFSGPQRQKRAVAWLRQRGCFVGYDYLVQRDGGVLHDAKSASPGWMRRLLGDDFFHPAVKIRFEQPLVIDDAVLDRLKELPSLRHLEARHCRLAPNVERRLGELRNLERLELEEASLNDEQLAALGAVTTLRQVNLQHNPFNGSGLAAWHRLERLEVLYLSDTQVSDENLKHLARLPNLERLYVGDTGLGDDGLKHVSQIEPLKFLDIDDLGHRPSRVTNRGIAQLAALRNLERLDLGEFPLNSAALDALESLPHLNTLWIYPERAEQAVQKHLITAGWSGPPYTLPTADDRSRGTK
jgi:hypothetical protein